MSLRTRWAACGLAVCGIIAASVPLDGQARPTALVGATVIDGSDGAPIPDAVVIVHRGVIVAVGPRATTRIPAGTVVTQLPGKWIIPGLVDMHSHLAVGSWVQSDRGLKYQSDTAATKVLAAVYPRFGVTTIRNPAGPTQLAVDLRNRIRRGELSGPVIFTAGAPLDAFGQENAQVAVTNESDIRREIARQVQAGVDFVKLYALLTPTVVAAATRESHRAGVPVLLHAWRTSWRDAVEAGVDGLTHISPGSADLLPAAHRQEFTRSLRGTQFLFDWFRYADFADTAVVNLVARMADHGVSVDPTLVALEQLAWADSASFYPPAMTEVLPLPFRNAPSPVRVLSAGWTAADFAAAKAQWPAMLAFTKLLADRGVRLTVGSDGGNPWFYHRELELLQAAGIPPADILRMATRNAAIVLRRTSEFGTIAVGRRADLLVLASDPLQNISATRDIVTIYQSGHVVPVDPCVRAASGSCTRAKGGGARHARRENATR